MFTAIHVYLQGFPKGGVILIMENNFSQMDATATVLFIGFPNTKTQSGCDASKT